MSKVLKIGFPKGGEDRKVLFECPDCWDQTLVDLGEDAIPAVRYMCFGCEKAWMEGEIRECIEGPHFFKPDERDPIPICKACLDKKIASDKT